MSISNIKKTITILRITLFLLVILTLVAYTYLRKQETYARAYLGYSSQLRVITQRIGKRVGEISSVGAEQSYLELSRRVDEFDHIIKILIYGEYVEGKQILPPSSLAIQNTTLKKLSLEWEETKKYLDDILANKDNVMKAQLLNNDIQALLLKLNSQYWKVLEKMEKLNSPNRKMIDIMHQLDDMATIADNIEKILSLYVITTDLEKALPTKVDRYFLDAEKIRIDNPGGETKEIFDEIHVDLETLQNYISQIVQSGVTLDRVYTESKIILKNNNVFLEDATRLFQSYVDEIKTQFIKPGIINFLGGFSILVLILLGYLFNLQKRLELTATEEKNKKIHQDVDNLLRELSDLASGNLGIKASGDSEITREIALSINYAVEALRKLVLHINEVTEHAEEMSKETETLMSGLASSSEQQEKEIIHASTSVQAMAKLAEQVANHANQSADVAKQSVTLANEGGIQVRKTIDGMVRIQAQVRATSAKMLRLSESSNEIGQIISLIDNIADQTNILSLNASIQAAMAGEAGLGFAVVADEIQHLAEKVGQATRDIESLVRSIQADTLEVIGAMDQTRNEMKEGGTLAFNAGKALEKIELVSNNLANHIQSITLSSSEQKSMSSTIVTMMGTVEDIAQKIVSDSLDIAAFTKKLTALMSQLRSSVSEFKLPGDGQKSQEK